MDLIPMLTKTADTSWLEKPGNIYEPKLDGIRALCYKKEGMKFFNRHGRLITAKYPEFTFENDIEAESCILDGEIVLYDENGNPDFTTLMKRHQWKILARDTRPATFAVFDILMKNGLELIHLPLMERKQILEETVKPSRSLEILLYTEKGTQLWELIKNRKMEGVIAKEKNSRYFPGKRVPAWAKIKAFSTIDCIIAGFRSDKNPVSSLALTVYNDENRLQLVGNVGTGFSDKSRQLLRQLLEPYITSQPPFDFPREYGDNLWVEPKFVCEVRYLEFGSKGMLRNPSFMHLREDKKPEECRLKEQLPQK